MTAHGAPVRHLLELTSPNSLIYILGSPLQLSDLHLATFGGQGSGGCSLSFMVYLVVDERESVSAELSPPANPMLAAWFLAQAPRTRHA